MSKKLAFERFVWFIEEVKNGKFPNATDIQEYFEVSRSTAQRDLDFMRDRLQVPLKYDRVRKGYYFDEADKNYELPLFWASNEELLLFAILKELIRDEKLKKTLKAFLKKITSFSEEEFEKISNSVSYKGIRLHKNKEGALETIAKAIIENKKMKINYYSVFADKDNITESTITPLHLIYYMGNWYLLAEKNSQLRTYAVSRIFNPKVLESDGEYHFSEKRIKEILNQSFGIYLTDKRKELFEVKLRFSKSISHLIETLIFHPEQKCEKLDSDEIIVSFKSTFNYELIREILRFGNEVEVIEPTILRKKIYEILKKSVKIYKK